MRPLSRLLNRRTARIAGTRHGPGGKVDSFFENDTFSCFLVGTDDYLGFQKSIKAPNITLIPKRFLQGPPSDYGWTDSAVT